MRKSWMMLFMVVVLSVVPVACSKRQEASSPDSSLKQVTPTSPSNSTSSSSSSNSQSNSASTNQSNSSTSTLKSAQVIDRSIKAMANWKGYKTQDKTKQTFTFVPHSAPFVTRTNYEVNMEISQPPTAIHTKSHIQIAKATGGETPWELNAHDVRIEWYLVGDKAYERVGSDPWNITDASLFKHSRQDEKEFGMQFVKPSVLLSEIKAISSEKLNMRKEGGVFILEANLAAATSSSSFKQKFLDRMKWGVGFHPHVTNFADLNNNELLWERVKIKAFKEKYWIDASTFRLKKVTQEVKIVLPFSHGNDVTIEHASDYRVLGSLSQPVKVPADVK